VNEAVDAWVSANYILGGATATNPHETVGTIDLGGGSVQVSPSHTLLARCPTLSLSHSPARCFSLSIARAPSIFLVLSHFLSLSLALSRVLSLYVSLPRAQVFSTTLFALTSVPPHRAPLHSPPFSLSLSLVFCLSACLIFSSVCLSFFSVCLSICLSVYLSVCLILFRSHFIFLYTYIHIHVHTSIYMYIYIHIYRCALAQISLRETSRQIRCLSSGQLNGSCHTHKRVISHI